MKPILCTFLNVKTKLREIQRTEHSVLSAALKLANTYCSLMYSLGEDTPLKVK